MATEYVLSSSKRIQYSFFRLRISFLNRQIFLVIGYESVAAITAKAAEARRQLNSLIINLNGIRWNIRIGIRIFEDIHFVNGMTKRSRMDNG